MTNKILKDILKQREQSITPPSEWKNKHPEIKTKTVDPAHSKEQIKPKEQPAVPVEELNSKKEGDNKMAETTTSEIKTKKTSTVLLDKDTLKEVKIYAANNELSISDVVEKAIKEFIKK